MSGIQQALLASFNVVTSVSVSVNVTGVSATGSPGAVSVNIVDPVVLPAGTVLMFDRASVGTAIPSGWTQFTSVGATSVLGLTIRGGTSTAANPSSSGTIARPSQTRTYSAAGSHNPGAFFPTAPPTPTTQQGAGGPPASGLGARSHPHTGHTHTVSYTAVTSPFPHPSNTNVGDRQGMKLVLIKSSSDSTTIPGNAVVFSKDTTVFSGFSRKTWPAFTTPAGTTPQPAAAGMYTISPDVTTTIPFPERINGPGNVLFTPSATSSNGQHNHAPPTTPNLIAAPGTSRNRGWPDTGNHQHPINSVDWAPTSLYNGGLGVGVWLQFTHLLPCISGSSQSVQSGMIVMFDGGTVPSGWALCDGLNGTPNLVGKYIGYNNALSTSNNDVGTPQVGGAPPAAPTQPGFDTSPGPSATIRSSPIGHYSVGNTWPHQHNVVSPLFYRTSPVPDSIRSHTLTTVDHRHINFSGDPQGVTCTFPVIPVFGNLTIRFIMKV